MKLIDPHVHMVCRTTDDYQLMARCGVVAVTEPAFWPAFDRSSVESFRDYFRQLADYEPKRAAKYGMQHYCWMCVNAKEAENVGLSREVIKVIPEFLGRPTVLGLGEIGLNKNTRNEITIFEEQVDLAARQNELILIHTPHLEDKHKGTSIMISILKNDGRIRPERVLIDHCEEHTIRMAKDGGYWCGLTVYPVTKCSPQRAVDILETVGTDRVMVNSAADWGESSPMTMVDTCMEFLRRGHGEEEALEVFHDNPCRFMGQNPKWKVNRITAPREA